MLSLFAVELLCVTMVIFFIEKGESLKCFECRSDVHDGCYHKVNLTWSKECPKGNHSSEVYCRKIKQKLKFKQEKSWTLIRECAYEKSSECYHNRWLDLAYLEVCECEKENCNSGWSYIPSALTIALVFGLTRLFNYIKANGT